MLEQINHRVPVTALANLDENVILAGEGSYLVAYNVQTNERLCRLNVLPRQSIHGILLLGSKHVLVWGGRLLVSIELILAGTELGQFKKISSFHLQDWILDIASSCQSQDSRDYLLAIVTAHNALALLPIQRVLLPANAPALVGNAVVGSNCILYSSKLTWLNSSRCLVASGTAFGDIVLWSCTVSETEAGDLSTQWQIHYNFSAHEGSLFGVDISMSLHGDMLDGCTRMLASCSDDRTICIWDISNLPHILQSENSEDRDTGFGGDKDRTANAPPVLARAMGHVSRIWHVRFCWSTTPCPDTELPLMLRSYGEDASVITWLLTKAVKLDEDKPKLTMQPSSAETAHAGKHIWSVAQQTSSFSTGGADGAIAIRQHNQALESGTSTNSRIGLVTNDAFKAYDFVDKDTLFVTHSDGRISLLDIHSNECTDTSPALPALRSYSIVATVGRNGFAAGADGTIYWYDAQNARCTKIAHAGSKIGGLFASIVNERRTKHIAVLVYTLSPSRLLYYPVAHVDPDTTSSLVQPALLEFPTDSVPTSFTTFTVMNGDLTYAAVGTRKGLVKCYEVSDAMGADGELVREFGLHGNVLLHKGEAITSLMWQADPEDVCFGYMHSTGRDGTHCTLRIRPGMGDSMSADVIHELELPFGPNIEKCAIARGTGNLWTWGFKSKDFVVFDITLQREIMRVECGGAHRNWSFQPTEQGGTFIWTKAGKVFRHTQTDLPVALLNTGGHGREIKAVAILYKAVYSRTVIATGAEDTDIKLSVCDDKGHLGCIQTLRKHNTGIQHLQWSPPGNSDLLLFSSGGFEEFFVWNVTARYEGIPGVGIAAVCESVHPNSGKSDLRIMAFEAVPTHGREWEITMAYSDSALKRWRYDRPNQWELLNKADYLTCCLTSTLSLPHDRRTKKITTSTDGHIALWSPDLTFKGRNPVHQNAILSCASLELPDGSSMIVTGGDDNALAFTRISPDFERKGDLTTLIIPRAHTSAITGVIYLPDTKTCAGEEESAGWVISVSIDQLIKVWKIEVDATQKGVDGVGVKRAAKGYTSVADVSGLAIYSERWMKMGNQHRLEKVRVVIVGVGVDIWDLTVRQRPSSTIPLRKQ